MYQTTHQQQIDALLDHISYMYERQAEIWHEGYKAGIDCMLGSAGYSESDNPYLKKDKDFDKPTAGAKL